MNCISVDQRDSKTVLQQERSLHEELIRFWRLKYIMFLSWLWQPCEPAQLLPGSPALCLPEAFPAPGAAPFAREAKCFFLLLRRVHWSKASRIGTGLALAFGWCQPELLQSWDVLCPERGRRCHPCGEGASPGTCWAVPTPSTLWFGRDGMSLAS